MNFFKKSYIFITLLIFTLIISCPNFPDDNNDSDDDNNNNDPPEVIAPGNVIANMSEDFIQCILYHRHKCSSTNHFSKVTKGNARGASRYILVIFWVCYDESMVNSA